MKVGWLLRTNPEGYLTVRDGDWGLTNVKDNAIIFARERDAIMAAEATDDAEAYYPEATDVEE